jgi:hypothetical protein
MTAVAMLNGLWFRPDGGRDRYFNEYAAAVLPLLGQAGAALACLGTGVGS